MTSEPWENPELWERLKPLFHAAMELPEAERERYVQEACGDDLVLREALQRLISASGDSASSAIHPPFNFRNLLPDPRAAFSPGDLVLRRFRIERPIGSGGMGEVYEAIDLELGRHIALKTIRTDIADNPRVLEHFKNEVKLAQRISGLHICRIHELYVLADSADGRRCAFLTMEFLNGATLADRIRESGPLPWKEVKTIALEICEGLRVMHEAGILHRDLKSRNVMLAERNGTVRAVVMDFGLAYEVRTATSETATNISEEHGVVGTVEYMAPEQFEGQTLTPASDIFALGVVMYELATGKHPFPSHTTLEAAVQRGRRPPAPSSIQKKLPHRCDEIVCRCLEFDPKKRYGSANEVKKELTAGPANFTNLRKDYPWAFRMAYGLLLVAIGWGGFRLFQLWRYDSLSSEGCKWYDSGVAALREGSYVKATRMLSAVFATDSHFAMAHARLAEAWANLDFDGKSSQEMMIAEGGEHHLRPLDNLYLNAIHATLTRDYAGAVLLYKKILHRLPEDRAQKAAGYVDLGMAYEREADPTRAHESYVKSESLDGDNPASYMHEAIVDARLHRVPEANQAFSKADAIFAREMNQEGQAELDYERGYEANVDGDSDTANRFLNQSLEEAHKIQDVQLEIRDLNQLSSVACASGHATEAADLAQRSINLAHKNNLDAWAAMGLARLANADVVQGRAHDHEAETAVSDALEIAQQSGQGRAEALANMALASLREQQHRWDEVIGPAKDSLAYYTQNGYFEAAADAALLLLRVTQRHGQFQETLQAANNNLDVAEKSGNKSLQMQAQNQVGMVYESAEQYPDALQHFQRAVELAEGETNRAYQAVSKAETLVKLGRFSDADMLLRAVDVDSVPSVAVSLIYVRIESLLSQEKYGAALDLTDNLIARHPELDTDVRVEVEHMRAVSEAHLHQNSDALEQVEGGAEVESDDDPTERWTLALMAAEVKVVCGRERDGRDESIAAEEYFASKGQLDSDLHAALLAVIASKALNDGVSSSKYSAKAVDILSALEHNWNPRTYHTYTSRPDLCALMRALPAQGCHAN